ncbi:MAG: alpha-mannosidase [Planctomycetes bacterium]|jgi:alpha-mannosidase|nr:alpha-mannosidase [Phycisphaerae bacterium]NBB96316.1 alpha-mannosidase [Planctomycetota bacterium]
MSLNSEWRDRLEGWIGALETLRQHCVAAIDFEYATTMDMLSPQEAATLSFQPLAKGSKPSTPPTPYTPVRGWGETYQYGWFRATATVPEEADGMTLTLTPPTNGESLIFVNGQARVGTQSFNIIAQKARAGETLDLLLECAAGNERVCATGPVPHGQRPFPPLIAPLRKFQQGALNVIDEDAFGLYYDIRTLVELRDSINDGSLRVAHIDAGIKDFTNICDPELPRDEFLESCRAARRRLKPLLEKQSGPTAPTMFAFGHGHLDVMWLWPLDQTRRKTALTLCNQLTHAQRFPQHKFLHSQPHLFWMLKRDYPELYGRVKRAVADGTVIADGASWVEMDTNISGGEALIRQFLCGKRFFKDEFGVDSQFLWMPDVFGYSAQMPQIMVGCGVKYFSTQKILWNYHGGETFPYNTFYWEGIDGSDVLVHVHNGYNSQTSPAHVIDCWNKRLQKDDISARLLPFGWGDGGGGPAIDHMEFVTRVADLEGCPTVKIATPTEYFEYIEQNENITNRYVGELYVPCHRGALTSQAKTKLGNRKCELALREAEMWGSAAAILAGRPMTVETFDDAWRTVMVNQFHDILPGSSIDRVYEEVEAAYLELLENVNAEKEQAVTALTDDGASMTVFNSLSWTRTVEVALPNDWAGATDIDGEALCVQEQGGCCYVEVEVPSCGWTNIDKAAAADGQGEAASAGVTATPRSLENSLIRGEFNDRGEIVSFIDKASGTEYIKDGGAGNVFRMFKDVPGKYDAWDIDSMYVDAPVELSKVAEIEVVGEGPLMARLRITRKLNNSAMTQVATLRCDSRVIEFDTHIDWHERHKLLKVSFETNLRNDEAIHEIQFGYLKRPTHRSRQFDADRFEVANQKYTAIAEARRGLAVLNDCKYGVDTLGGAIHLSLLRAPTAPDPAGDVGHQSFTYAVMAWSGAFADSGVVRAGYELNVPPTCALGKAEPASLLQIDADNVIVEAVKLAEDGSGDVIVRLYEAVGTTTRASVLTSLPVTAAAETNMLEGDADDREFADGRAMLEFTAFEIKTLRLKR